MSDPVIEDPAIAAHVKGLRDALTAERTATAAARAEAIKAATDRDAANTRLTEFEGKARSWEEYSAKIARERDEKAAARLALQPDSVKAFVAKRGFAGDDLAEYLDSLPAVTPPADPAAPPTPPAAPPVVPGTGRVAGGQQGDGVPANVQAWVDGTDVGAKYRNASPTIKAMAYAKEGPGANAPT